jgi:hypothetical protein
MNTWSPQFQLLSNSHGESSYAEFLHCSCVDYLYTAPRVIMVLVLHLRGEVLTVILTPLLSSFAPDVFWDVSSFFSCLFPSHVFRTCYSSLLVVFSCYFLLLSSIYTDVFSVNVHTYDGECRKGYFHPHVIDSQSVMWMASVTKFMGAKQTHHHH